MPLIFKNIWHFTGQFLLSVLCLGSSISTANTHTHKSVNELASLLIQGGYVIYLRHAQTDHSQIDKIDFNIKEYHSRLPNQPCQTQRNLSKEGRETAEMIGHTFKALKIPVGKVYTSPFCRCVDTAALAFGENYSVSEELYFAVKASPKDKERLAKSLRKMLSQPPPENTNTIIVSHTANLKEAANIWPKPEGVAYVFKPLGDGKHELKGRIAPDEWENLLSKN